MRKNYLTDTNLSLKAKGLLALMLECDGEKPESACTFLAGHCKESRKVIKKLMGELIKAGYLEFEKETTTWYSSSTVEKGDVE